MFMMSSYFLYLHFVPEKKWYEYRNETEKKKFQKIRYLLAIIQLYIFFLKSYL